MCLPIDSLRYSGTAFLFPPNLGDVHVLFSMATNDVHAPLGGTLLIDNIRFEPVPNYRGSALGFPLANRIFGVVPRQNPDVGRVPFPADQVLANVTTTYESALSILALLNTSEPHQTTAGSIADAFVYALENDSSGLPLPAAADGSTGLHNAYSSGDLALFNDQGPGAGLAGDVRLAGFTAGPESCGGSGYCLVLDGATGGNNAFAMLALLAAYEHSRTRGTWTRPGPSGVG